MEIRADHNVANFDLVRTVPLRGNGFIDKIVSLV